MAGRKKFSMEMRRKVWAKRKRSQKGDSHGYDKCGAEIAWESYDTHGKKGWEIDHIDPVSNNGGHELSNLQPLHWRNNQAKGDTLPGKAWDCAKNT